MTWMSMIPSTKEKTGAFRDWRGQISWGRICAAVALVVAVMLSFKPAPDVRLIEIWLSVAVGNYGISKAVESFGIFKRVGVEAPVPSGGESSAGTLGGASPEVANG